MDPIKDTTQALATVVEKLPIGTNSALYQFLWMLVSGALLASRGAVFPALQSLGLKASEVRRTWAAFRYGAWTICAMLQTWQTYVEDQGKWQAHQYAGYYVKAVDITAYWRPTMQGLKSQHYDTQAGRALPAVVLGMVGRVGSVGDQRMALLTDLIRGDLTNPSESALHTDLVKQVAAGLADDEMPVFDAGFKVKALLAAGLPRFTGPLVLQIVYGETSILLPGDATTLVEEALVTRHQGDLRSTVLLAPRHGDATAATPAFLQAVAPEVAVISVGADTWGRYPAPAVLARLMDVPVYRTDQDGTIEIVSDGEKIEMKTER